MKKIYKFTALGLISLFLAFSLLVSLTLLVNSPKIYPDQWLSAEAKINSLFHKITLPIKIARLSWQSADKELLMPVYGVRVSQVEDTWNAPRSEGRVHEGQDIFAPRGTPVFSMTGGYVTRMGLGDLGGNFVYIAGKGGVRYYYAHFDRIPEGLEVGQKVTPDMVIGFVGNTGNAENTPYHLHFGAYRSRTAFDPLPFLVNR